MRDIDKHKSVQISNSNTKFMSIQFGALQRLGPVLFTLYTQPLVQIIERRSLFFYVYADDTQMYKACRIEDLPSSVSSTFDCISDENMGE